MDSRRQRLLQLSAAGAFIAILAVVVVVIVVSSESDKGGDPPNPSEEGEIGKLLSGIPQDGMLLGKPDAPVKVYEFGDLQCPFCKANAEQVTPGVIENQVRNGEANITFNQFIIIGPESVPAGEAALAAGAQNRAWNFIELFYRNQGEENSGYVTEHFIESIGKSAGIPDLEKWNKERKSGKYKKQLELQTKQAEKLEFGGTPSFAIEGPGTKGLEKIATPETPGQLEAEIKKAS
ncbi:MAG: thioredoxin domain-containing protein [Actinobacteria bacterium]|nr:thioredoxin domain-containing protein [Actinomycetota bacterium]